MANEKYRPYFSGPEMLLLIDTLKTHPSQSPSKLALARYLEGFALKIERGVISPSLSPKGTKQEQLIAGLDLDDSQSRRKNDTIDLYLRWTKNEVLTIPELERVMEYRFTAELMEDAEYNQYAAAMMARISPKVPRS